MFANFNQNSCFSSWVVFGLSNIRDPLCTWAIISFTLSAFLTWLRIIEAFALVFLQHSMIAFVGQIIVSLCSILIAFVFFNTFWESNMWLSIAQVVLNAYFLYFMYRVFRRIIDFEMDFPIITPESITTFSQAGLTSAKDKTLKHNQIKSVTREQEWWIKTFFDFWEIHIKWIWDGSSNK